MMKKTNSGFLKLEHLLLAFLLQPVSEILLLSHCALWPVADVYL
jgi:hypothetical protein